MSRWNCNIPGGYVDNFVSGCFRPDVDIYVFRDASPYEEEIYFGKAANIPNLSSYLVVDIQYDDYNYVFSIEVK